jgi:hypothetical protein
MLETNRLIFEQMVKKPPAGFKLRNLLFVISGTMKDWCVTDLISKND